MLPVHCGANLNSDERQRFVQVLGYSDPKTPLRPTETRSGIGHGHVLNVKERHILGSYYLVQSRKAMEPQHRERRSKTLMRCLVARVL